MGESALVSDLREQRPGDVGRAGPSCMGGSGRPAARARHRRGGPRGRGRRSGRRRMGGPSELGRPWAPVAHGGAVRGRGLAPPPGLIGPLALWSTSGLGTLALGPAARGATHQPAAAGAPTPRPSFRSPKAQVDDSAARCRRRARTRSHAGSPSQVEAVNEL